MSCDDSFELISEKVDFAAFIEEHANEPQYQAKLKDLQQWYCAIRKTRADGSCFYRGLAFAHLESLLGKQEEVFRFRDRLVGSQDELLNAGFEEHHFRPSYKIFLSIVELADKDGTLSGLHKVFNHPYFSDTVVKYLRLITSAYLRNRAEFYQPFVEEGMNITDFCAQHVEPMTTVSDHIHISALTQALDIPLQVEYADSVDSATNRHIFPEGSTPSVYMLYKQDHYTILYKVPAQGAEQ
ncbi:ubiquitin thioesterase OTUB2 [Hyperolius riggenbachi]|uniref:ubiquitin thioesterase OTUB2 n=1 Tax=Hyperolius riggenbachi TaxID=752182 RepID=UPI0035A2A778